MPYRVEVAKTNRAKCVGRKPCKGSQIDKGSLKIGTFVQIKDFNSWKWRHWGCTTQEVLHNLKEEIPEVEEVDGYDELPPNYQEKIRKAWEVGHIAEEDIPETAKAKPEEEEGEDGGDPASSPAKPKKGKAAKADGDTPKKTTKKRAKKEEDAEEAEEEVKPKAKKGKKTSKKIKEESESELSEEDVKPPPKKAKKSTKKGKEEPAAEPEDVKPSSKKAKKPASKKRGKAVDPDDE